MAETTLVMPFARPMKILAGRCSSASTQSAPHAFSCTAGRYSWFCMVTMMVLMGSSVAMTRWSALLFLARFHSAPHPCSWIASVSKWVFMAPRITLTPPAFTMACLYSAWMARLRRAPMPRPCTPGWVGLVCMTRMRAWMPPASAISVRLALSTDMSQRVAQEASAHRSSSHLELITATMAFTSTFLPNWNHAGATISMASASVPWKGGGVPKSGVMWMAFILAKGSKTVVVSPPRGREGRRGVFFFWGRGDSWSTAAPSDSLE
mmetsp:Transcript_48958/g.95702  ORF Transcript_48958/g.95702 Transcript_48958/m.95702 type:complete len:264 (-) Transcript_48958:250-1041(-)